MVRALGDPVGGLQSRTERVWPHSEVARLHVSAQIHPIDQQDDQSRVLPHQEPKNVCSQAVMPTHYFVLLESSSTISNKNVDK